MSKRTKTTPDPVTKEKRQKTEEKTEDGVEKSVEPPADSSAPPPTHIRARYFAPAKCKVPSAHALVWEEADGVPEAAEDVLKLVDANKLRLGDVINFGNFRDSQSHVVLVDNDDSSKVSLVRNRDDSGAGYLSIPEDVIRHIPDFRQTYSDIIEQTKIYIHFRLTSSDRFLDEKLGFDGDKAVAGWLFDVVYHKGSLHQFTAYSPDGRSETFELERTSWAKITEFFQARATETLSTLQIQVTLLGDKYGEYKTKYGEGAADWVKAAPDLPVGWRGERGQAQGGSDNYSWNWVFSGPASSESKAKENLETFLDGFSFSYVEAA